jgi:hypothetical protein
MRGQAFKDNADFYNFVKALTVRLGDFGFANAQMELSRLFDMAWTTSSELFGEIGLACKRILVRDGKLLPAPLKKDLKKIKSACLKTFL